MMPTLSHTGDYILHDRLSHKIGGREKPSIARGTLITYVSPRDPSRLVCKRVIGLPGDIVCVDPIKSMLRPTATNIAAEHTVVPQNHYWTQGDNASNSYDSRTYGPVPFGLVKGQVRAILTVGGMFLRDSECADFILRYEMT